MSQRLVSKRRTSLEFFERGRESTAMTFSLSPEAAYRRRLEMRPGLLRALLARSAFRALENCHGYRFASTRDEAGAMIEAQGGKSVPALFPRRPPMWWPERRRAPSCARPRSWASRCSPRRNSLPCLAAGSIRINYKKGHRFSRRAGALFVFCCIGCVERGERYAGTDTL